jgi:hypothetical protein
MVPTGTQPFLSANAPSGVCYVRVRAQVPCGLSGPSKEVTVVVP